MLFILDKSTHMFRLVGVVSIQFLDSTELKEKREVSDQTARMRRLV